LALYRIREQEWENYVKQKFQNQYSNAKSKMEQDLSKINGFFGKPSNPEEVQDIAKKNKKNKKKRERPDKML
jgi:UDP-galactopyranose mutase